MTIFEDMRVKAWTPDQVRELVEAAKAAGITQQTLASVYIGCTLGALGHWMTGRNGRKPTGYARRALSWAALCIATENAPEIEPEPGDN